MKETLNIEGMHCGGCVRSVTNALKRVVGVSDASVSLSEKKVDVTFDENITKLSDLKAAIEEAGYQVTEHVPA